MLTLVPCQTCKTSHDDHFECSWCHFDFGYLRPKANFCPECGVSLTTFQPPVETGVTDQNGRVIYAGDVLEISETHDQLSPMTRVVYWKGVVIWERGCFWLQRRDRERFPLYTYLGSPEWLRWFVVMEKKDAIE